MVSPVLRLSIDSELGNVHLVGLAVHKICEYLGLDDEGCSHVELAVVEAVTNSIRHAYGGAPGHLVEVVATVDPDHLRLEVIDDGRPVPAAVRRHPPPPPIEELPEGGYGMFLIFELMDSVDFERRDGRNVVVLTKLRPAPTPGS